MVKVQEAEAGYAHVSSHSRVLGKRKEKEEEAKGEERKKTGAAAKSA